MSRYTAPHNECWIRMSRYDRLLRLAEKLWQKERAQRATVDGVRR
jgi:hypothetical protein